MPQVECILIFEGNHGEAGDVLIERVREILDNHDLHVVSLEHVGTRPTNEELDEIRWVGEGGAK